MNQIGGSQPCTRAKKLPSSIFCEPRRGSQVKKHPQYKNVYHGCGSQKLEDATCCHSGRMQPNWCHVVLGHQEPPGGRASDYFFWLMVAPWIESLSQPEMSPLQEKKLFIYCVAKEVNISLLNAVPVSIWDDALYFQTQFYTSSTRITSLTRTNDNQYSYFFFHKMHSHLDRRLWSNSPTNSWWSSIG